MFSVNGFTFTPGSAFDHATNMLGYMNSQLQAQNLPTLLPNNGNALWWTLLAQGQFDSQVDQEIIQATNSLQPSLADDQQVLNLLPIAGTNLIPASFSVVNLTAFAGAGLLVIPTGTLVPFGTYNFSTLTALNILASGNASTLAVCTTSGPITIPAGGINLNALPGINNLNQITNFQSAIPGNAIETPAQARVRIIAGKTIGVGIDGAIGALRQLPGLGQAIVWMNPLISGTLPVSGLSVNLPARTAWIVVQNDVPNIALTYLAYMDLPTSGGLFSPARSQNYVTQAGQSFPVSYDLAIQQQIFAQVYVDQNKIINNGFLSLIQNTLVGLNGSLGLGQRVSSEIASLAFAGFTPATILAVLLSPTSGGPYGPAVQPSINSIPFFAPSGIQVILQ